MQRIFRQLAAFAALLTASFFPSLIAQSFLTETSAAWYEGLHKPFFTPQAWIFGAVWTILYFFMACASWMVWKRRGFFCKELLWFYGQLAVNAFYVPFFFGHHLLVASALLTALLLAMAIYTMRLFVRVDPYAGVLMASSITWLIFALILGICTAYLNA